MIRDRWRRPRGIRSAAFAAVLVAVTSVLTITADAGMWSPIERYNDVGLGAVAHMHSTDGKARFFSVPWHGERLDLTWGNGGDTVVFGMNCYGKYRNSLAPGLVFSASGDSHGFFAQGGKRLSEHWFVTKGCIPGGI